MLSPDVERVLEAVNVIKGSSIVPEDIDDVVHKVLVDLGKIQEVLGMSPIARRAYLLGYAERIKDENTAV